MNLFAYKKPIRQNAPAMELDSARQFLQTLIDQALKDFGHDDPRATYKGVSLAIDRNHAYIQQYMKKGNPLELKEREREALADLFKVDANRFKSDDNVRGAIQATRGETARPAHAIPQETLNQLPWDVPLVGTAAGADEGAFQMNTGDPVDYKQRLPGIAKARDVYAVEMIGTSMYPAIRDGELLYVHPHKRPVPGDDVVIQIKNGDDGSVTAFVKRLKRMDDLWVYVEQFGPPGDRKFPMSKVKAVHKVLTLKELTQG